MEATLKDQIASLMDSEFFRSAEIMSSFLVSSSSTHADNSPSIRAENLVHLGDSLSRSREHRRAIHTYKQALQHLKLFPKQNITVPSKATLSTRSSSFSSSSNSSVPVNEYEIKYKIASCYSSLGDNRVALAEMESIPSKCRTIQMSLLMGKLYKNSRQPRYSIACYKECLRQCPYVIEACVALAELGVSSKDIISLISQHPSNKTGRASSDQVDSNRWLHSYVEALCCVASNDYKGSLELFGELLLCFPNNVHILLEIAKVQAITGKTDDAIINFEKARSLDPNIITYMDEYAMLLKIKIDDTKLNKLVHDLLIIDPTRAEVFVALSVLWEKKDERGALSYAEKSIRIDERNIPGYIMKGMLLLSLKRAEAASNAFRIAQELRSDLRSYQGLVQSYLAFSKTKEALHTAREAMKAMPHSAKALKLVGDVYCSSQNGREKAKKFYESALRLETGYLDAALSLAELHVIEGRNGDAVALLERYLKDWADDSLHLKLAQVYASNNILQDALAHFQSALRINPQNEAAKKGLERLEKLMRGVDPDAPEEEEENDVEDADGEGDEPELY